MVKALQVCSVGGMAQFIDASDGDARVKTVGYAGQPVLGKPKMFYLNGDDIEHLLDYSVDSFERAMSMVRCLQADLEASERSRFNFRLLHRHCVDALQKRRMLVVLNL
jgi:hypothetical protein